MTSSVSSLEPRCQGCASTSFVLGQDRSIECAYCRTTYSPMGPVCPDCGSSIQSDGRACPSCGADTVRHCQSCGALNPPDVRRCLVCGEDFAILEALFARVSGTTVDRLHQQREQATAAKAKEKRASRARMAELWAADADRREAVAQAQAKREEQERNFLTVAVTIAAFVVIAVVIALVVLSRVGIAPLPAAPRVHIRPGTTGLSLARFWIDPWEVWTARGHPETKVITHETRAWRTSRPF